MTLRNVTISYEEFASKDQLDNEESRLIESAWEARKNSYAPYSHFHVWTAVLTKDGDIFQGSNQENVNYKVSCAERVVLDSIGAAGLRDRVVKIAIFGWPAGMLEKSILGQIEKPITPCGQCRQDLKEIQDNSWQKLIIILASPTTIYRIVWIENLLPLPFGPSNLGISFEKWIL